MLGRFTCQINLDEQIDPAHCCSGRIVQFGEECGAVNRMHNVEAAGLLRFVRLEMADEMPPQGQIRRLIHFRQRFLHFVFAEIDLPELSGGANIVGGKCFRDGDEAD